MPDVDVANAINAQTYVAQKQAVATLAAAMIQVRGNATPQQVNKALVEAAHLLFPPRDHNEAYEAWKRANLSDEALAS